MVAATNLNQTSFRHSPFSYSLAGDIQLGKVIFVDSAATNANTGNLGTSPDAPMSTLTSAKARCVANSGFTVLVAEGHTETISTAGGITWDVAGVKIRGCGRGANRPTFTFSATTSTFLITAANTTMENMIGTPSVDNVVAPFGIQAANCTFGTPNWPMEWQDSSSTVEALRAVLGNASASNLTINLRHVGFTGGNALVNSVRLVGSVGARVNVDFYGIVTTAVVEFVTTLSSDVIVTGYMYVSGTTNGSKNVVDTVTGSLWYAEIRDGAAGQKFSGGSAAALASDDVSGVSTQITTLQAEISGAAGVASWPTAAAYANAVSLAEVLAYIQDGTRRGTGSALPANTSLNDHLPKVITNAAATLVNGTTIFTIAGGPIEIISLVARCVTANDATASTLQWNADPTDGAAATISGASSSLANAAAGAIVVLQGTALSTAALLNATGVNLGPTITTIVGAGIITTVVATGSTTGTWMHHMVYRPLTAGVTVT